MIADYIIKPNSEQPSAHKPSLLLHRQAQTEALAYAIACELGLSHLTPEVHLTLVNDSLASVQPYIPNHGTLRTLLQTFQRENKTDEEVCSLIDQRNFEELMIFLWVIYDTDAHIDNFLVISDNPPFLLAKIDNALSFPCRNRGFFNALSFLPNAQKTLSDEAKNLVRSIDSQEIVKWLDLYEMKEAIPPFQDRIALLKALIEKELTIYQIETQLLFKYGATLSVSARCTRTGIHLSESRF